MNTLNFEEVCEDTLDSLAEYFEELLETCPHIKDYDVNHSVSSPLFCKVIHRVNDCLQMGFKALCTAIAY